MTTQAPPEGSATNKTESARKMSPHRNAEPLMTNRFSQRYLFLCAQLLALFPSFATAQGTAPQTAVKEIRKFEKVYSEAFNKKDGATVAAMYAPNAIFIPQDGGVLVGQDTIRKMFLADAPKWPQVRIEPESTRVVGQTAWVTGTVHFNSDGGGENASRYLIVLRRGSKSWKINSLAVVPQALDSAPPATLKVHK